MSFTITVPFTDKPLEATPDGTSLVGVSFATKEDAIAFFNSHGGSFVEVTDAPIP